MPRTADRSLEKRILDAGYKLWSEGGEAALTMRDVAVAAGTTTPTVYQRFRNKQELVHFLRERARRKMFFAIRSSSTVLEACRRALDFTLAHGQEYLLLTSDWAVRLASKEPLPSFDFLRQLLARELGGTPAKQTKLALALVAMVHGAAILLLTKDISDEVLAKVRLACLSGCEALLRAASRNGFRSRRS